MSHDGLIHPKFEDDLIARVEKLNCEKEQMLEALRKYEEAQQKLEAKRDALKAELALCHRTIEEVRPELHSLRAQVARLTAALDGLFVRHCDGSEEQYWAEWDTANAARMPKEGEQ